jgi:hypothetical protein
VINVLDLTRTLGSFCTGALALRSLLGRAREPPFWRGSLPLDVADRAAQIWVIWAFLPAWRHAALMLGRADERAFSSGLCR